MTYATASIAVRVSTAITVGFAMAFLTASTGSAETRRVVIRVYETGIGDVALRTAAIRTAASIVELAGVDVGDARGGRPYGARPAIPTRVS